VAQLCLYEDEFSALDARVLLVTFGTPDQGRAWLRETSAPFPLLFDPGRAGYRAFSLDRSFLRSWNWRTVQHYAQLLLRGRKWRGIQGDSTQLGGDVILDRRGFVRFLHRSRDPGDRPRVPMILGVLRDLASKEQGGGSPPGAGD
jgi:hypothetical protein